MSSRSKYTTSVEDLRDIVSDRWCRPKNPFDEVYPNIYIGDSSSALCLPILVSEGINFVLNGADSCPICLMGDYCGGCVRTRAAYYQVGKIAFKPIAAIDDIKFPIYRFFAEATEFIDQAMNEGGEKIFAVRTAKDVMLLKMYGVTHILNAAFGPDPDISVETNDKYYSRRGFACDFLGIPAVDLEVFKLHYFFKGAVDFIEDAIKKNGKILVHCREGISRSATLVIAYLMMKKHMSALEAVRLVRSKRQIYPNDGFLEQLCDLDLRLRNPRRY